MNSVLLKLKKAIERAIEPESPTREITLAEFPGHVIKSLEVILADTDEERAARRLALIKAQVDETSAFVKQAAGAAEDLESVRVKVVVFEEPGLTAKPTVEHEQRIPGAKRDLAEGREEPLQKAVDALQHEIAELTRVLGGSSSSDPEKTVDSSDAKTTSEKAAKTAMDVRKEDAKDAASGESQSGHAGQPAGAQDGTRTATKESTAVSWPLDMNTTMSGAQSVTKADAEFDWGPDPDLGPRAA
jgi:hypothetical protein